MLLTWTIYNVVAFCFCVYYSTAQHSASDQFGGKRFYFPHDWYTLLDHLYVLCITRTQHKLVWGVFLVLRQIIYKTVWFILSFTPRTRQFCIKSICMSYSSKMYRVWCAWCPKILLCFVKTIPLFLKSQVFSNMCAFYPKGFKRKLITAMNVKNVFINIQII